MMAMYNLSSSVEDRVPELPEVKPDFAWTLGNERSVFVFFELVLIFSRNLLAHVDSVGSSTTTNFGCTSQATNQCLDFTFRMTGNNA